MKKVLYTILAAAIATVACTKITDDSNVKLDKTEAPAVTIVSAGTVGDSLVATITPAAKTGYYAYVITTADKVINGEDLLKGKYIGKAGYNSEVILKEDEGEITIVSLNGLQPGAEYAITAVAASTMGVMTETSTASCTLVDPYAPGLTGYAYEVEDSVMTFQIKFDREVTLQENAYAVASFWGILDKNCDPSTGQVLAPQKQVKVTALTVSGQNLNVTVPKEECIAGAYVSINFPAGIVKSPAGNGNNAYTTAIFIVLKGPNRGIFGHYDNENFDLAASDKNPEYVIDVFWKDARFAIVSATNAIVAGNEGTEAVYTEKSTGYSSERKAELAEENMELSAAGDTVTFSLPVAPKTGEELGFNVPKKTFYDIWGNCNNEFEITGIPVGKLEFSFKDVEAGCNNAYATIVPGVKGVYFYADYCEKDPANTDDALIKEAKDYIQYWAEQDKITFAEEYVEYFANDDETELEALNLESEKDYQFYGFFMLADGTVVSEVYRQDIKTVKFERPTETSGTYVYPAKSIFREEIREKGRPVTFKDGVGEAPDTLVISGCGYNNDTDYVFVLDKSGNAVMKTVNYGVSFGAEYGATFIGECSALLPQYAYFQSYYDSLTKTLNIGCLYFAQTGTPLSNYPNCFVFDNSVAPAPTATRASKRTLTKNVLKQKPSHRK